MPKTTDLGQGRHPAPFICQRFSVGRIFECSALSARYCFSSKRLADDQLPGVPELELARTRHHILVVGRVVVNCETVVVWFTNGELKVSESSIWIV